MKNRVLATALAVSMVASIIVGCGSSVNNAASATSGGTETTAASDSDTSKETTSSTNNESETPKYGGRLRYASHAVTSTPGYTPENTNNASLIYLTTAYESLISYNEDGSFKGVLATDWETDPNEPSITWTLRDGVQFADGTPFNADAVKTNIEEYQKNQRNETKNVASCEVIDDTHIKMVLNKWNTSTLESVGFFVYYMSPEALKDVDTLRNSSCGTGPFQVTEFNPGVSVKYAKNEKYWQEGKPYLDGVEIYIVDEPTTRASAFEAGEYDLIRMNNLTVAQEISSMGQTDFGKIETCKNKSGQGLVMTGLIPNSVEDGPFQDPVVRRAVCEAIDADSLAEAFGYGQLTVTDQWASPDAVTYDKDLNAMHYDPEHAKELLAEAGYPDGFTTTLTTDAGNKDIFTAAANMLEEVGVHCEINLVDESAQSSMYSTGNWSGLMGHFAAISPDLGLYMGRHLDKDGAFYAKGIQHPKEAMDLLEKIRTAATDDEKVNLEHQMQDLMYSFDDGIALFGRPLFVQNEPGFKYDYVKNDGYKTYHDNTWDLANCWLDK